MSSPPKQPSLREMLEALKDSNMSEDYRWKLMSNILNQMCQALGIDLDFEIEDENAQENDNNGFAKFMICILAAIAGIAVGAVICSIYIILSRP